MMRTSCGVVAAFLNVPTTLSPRGTVTTIWPLAAPSKLNPALALFQPAIRLRCTVFPVVVAQVAAFAGGVVVPVVPAMPVFVKGTDATLAVGDATQRSHIPARACPAIPPT